ncbi:MAG: PA0069 family radical SAM protein [Gemmataceae bacterium]|nr:PA0069 family radical SAM protein [Gemmataceae bacterium]
MMADERIHGRGASGNPANRFELICYEADEETPLEDRPAPATQFFKDATRSIIATNESPDIFFDASINPYRGCEHGCVYCYARPYHEYLGLSAGLDFETKIFVKENAPELLRKELSSPRWQPKILGICGVTDPYQPIERRLGITRRCLEVLAEFRNPVALITKNHLVTRDADLLAELARHRAASASVAVTTLDTELARRMEPRATAPHGRLQAIRELAQAGVPVGVLVAPVIPGLTDHEIPAILEAAKDVGAHYAGFVLLRLPYGLGAMFETWLEQHYPDRKDKVLGRIRASRDGKLNDPRFGNRMKGEGIFADMIQQVFTKTRRQLGLDGRPKLSTAAFRRPSETQPLLFK